MYINSMETISLSNQQLVWLIALSIWSLTWKAFALWKAAGQKDKVWFVALIILNTAGLLEIFYIFVFSKRNTSAKTDS